MLNQKRWDIKVPAYRDVVDATDKQNKSSEEHAVVEFEVEMRLSTVENKDEPFNERYSSDALEKLSHKELRALAEKEGVNTDALNADEKGAFPMSRIIEDMVELETKRVKKQVMTKIYRRKLGIGYHRYSHFVNLHDALAT